MKHVITSMAFAMSLFASSADAMVALPVCTMEYAPVCGQTYQNGYPTQQTYSNACMLSQSGATFLYQGQCNGQTYPYYPQPYQQLSVQSVSGPTQLSVNQTGTWTINVIGAQGQLSYHVTWGDEVTPMYGYANASMIAPITNTGTFTHTYNRAGTFTVVVYVTDSAGRSSQGTVTVHVGNSYYNYPQYPVYYDDYPDYYDDQDYWDYLWYKKNTKKKQSRRNWFYDDSQYFGTGFHPISSYTYDYPYTYDGYNYNQYNYNQYNTSWDDWSQYSDVSYNTNYY